MESQTVFEMIEELGVVPVIAIDSVDDAIPMADAFLRGGLPVVEITFRTAAAAQVIAKLRKERPKLIVGAGTVLTRENLESAQIAGAAFAVAPGLNPEIVNGAHELGMPFMPGVLTPTDIEHALSLGCRTLKFFPAEAAGGIVMLNALAAPYRHTGVKFVPTGGINLKNLEAYLSLDGVAAVGGTWLAKKDDFAHAKWDDIAERSRLAVDVTRRVRSGHS